MSPRDLRSVPQNNMDKFNRRFGSFPGQEIHPCMCGLKKYCGSCEDAARGGISMFNTLIDEKKKSAVWDTTQQECFISMLERGHRCLVNRGVEAIWATVVFRQAYDVADWVVDKGYTSYEPHGHYHSEEFDEMCVPYDASTWRDWIRRELSWYVNAGGDVSITNGHIKAAVAAMVRKKYIRIPLKSGLPLYYWFLEGYDMYDFCSIYACIEFIWDGKFQFHEMEFSLKHHMDLVIRAKTGFRLVYVMYVCSTGEEFEDEYTAKVLEKVYFMYKDRKETSAAIKIQCLFRVYRSKRLADDRRAHPDHLFHPEYSGSRRSLLNIDASRFRSTIEELPS